VHILRQVVELQAGRGAPETMSPTPAAPSPAPAAPSTVQRPTAILLPSLRPAPAPLLAPSLPTPDKPAPPPAAAEPVIQVTIGRVEVRAAAPPASPPPPRPAPAPPRMTLDEYLRARR
jgi:hypothetical protein